MIRYAFGRREHEPYTESSNSPRAKKAIQVKGKLESMLIIFFDVQNSSWRDNKPIPQTTLMLYGDCVKMCEDFASNFGDDKRTGCCVTTTHRLTLFTGEFLTNNNMTVVPHPPYFSVSPTEDKTERPPF
jgi:hypothetical protein